MCLFNLLSMHAASLQMKVNLAGDKNYSMYLYFNCLLKRFYS